MSPSKRVAVLVSFIGLSSVSLLHIIFLLSILFISNNSFWLSNFHQLSHSPSQISILTKVIFFVGAIINYFFRRSVTTKQFFKNSAKSNLSTFPNSRQNGKKNKAFCFKLSGYFRFTATNYQNSASSSVSSIVSKDVLLSNSISAYAKSSV